MNKKILIISTSPRRNGNSAKLAEAFSDGAAESGNEVEFISLHDKTIDFCRGCLACQKTQRCLIHDDADIIREKMLNADVIVFATPIYYYEMSGQMKTMLDRANPLYSSDYAFRDIYMLSTAAENEETVPERAVSGLEGWIDCFENARLAGTLFCGGVTDTGDIADNSKLQEAYNMGKSV
ncbi:MAG: flavodoxin family protein [Ruminococcus sp.]|nr:flavodoxin family protein [Ruminococcus sp.]MDE6424735.1 flavodoxin family protein [Ruminococcus sp.]